MLYISSNNGRHPVPKTLTALHYTCRHFTSSHLNFTQLHFTTLSFGLTPFKIPTAPFHLTSLHFTSLHFTALLNDFHHTSMVFASSCDRPPRHRFFLFPCVYKQMLRWFPRFQVATTCFSCSPPDLNLLVTNFIFRIHVK